MTEANTAVKKVALAYSGGLDSTLCVDLLKKHYGSPEILLVMVDVGQGDDELTEAYSRITHLPHKIVTIDAKRVFTQGFIPQAVKANGSYGGYPLSSSMTRQLIASEVADVARAEGCDAVAEGSTGKGNDQFRFHNTFTLLAPELRVLTPVRDLNLSRDEERRLAHEAGLTFKEGVSDDLTCWGRAIGSGEVDDLATQVPEDEYKWWAVPHRGPEQPTRLTVTFHQGVPVRVNDIEDLDAIIPYLNEIVGRYGIGQIDVIEDGIMGLKSREIYEAPAACLLLALHRDLERLCLTKRELAFKANVDAEWASLVYHGHWFHPLREELDAFVDRSQQMVSGEMTVELYRGGFRVLQRSSPHALFEPSIRSVERDSFNQSQMGPVVETYASENAQLGRRAALRTTPPEPRNEETDGQ